MLIRSEELGVPAVLSVIISLVFEQVVTLQLLNQHKPEKEESSSEEEEEERPQRPSLEHSVSDSSGAAQTPLRREGQVVKEADPLPPQALLSPQDDIQRREGEPTEVEALSQIRDDSLPPELACVPSQRALEPPTSVPPLPPGPVDSESEETVAARPLQDTCGGEPDSFTRLSVTSDPQKGDPLAMGHECPGGEHEPPEFKKDEDVTSSARSSRELSGPEAASAAAGAVPEPKHCAQHSR